MVPLSKLPTFEVIEATLKMGYNQIESKEIFSWNLVSVFYVDTTLENGKLLTIPFHRCKANFQLPEDVIPSNFTKFDLDHGNFPTINPYDQLQIKNSGRISLLATAALEKEPNNYNDDVNVDISFYFSNHDTPVSINMRLKPSLSNTRMMSEWSKI